jgi:type I restriction enzyme S subunit
MTEKNGKLPKGWKWVRLGDICDFIGGMQPPKSVFSNKALQGYVRLVQIQDFRRSDFAVYIPQDEAKRTFEETDVMIGRYGPPVFQILRGLSGAYNVALMKTAPNADAITKDFLFYLLKESSIQNAVISQSQRSAGQSGVQREFVENLIVPLPPLPEQKRIVAILNEQMASVEKARAAAEAQLQAAKTLPAAYLREVFDSPEAQKWERKKLGEVLLNIETGKSMSCDERPAKEDEWGILKVSAVSWGKFKPEQNKVIPRTFTPLSKYEVHSGDLIISRANTKELVGAIVLVGETRSHLMLSDKTLRLVTNTNVEKAYIEIALREKIAREYIESIATGTSDSMRNISQENIKKIPVFLPSKSKQISIINHLNLKQSATENLCRALQDQLNTIKQLPAALLRQAFNGEL